MLITIGNKSINPELIFSIEDSIVYEEITAPTSNNKTSVTKNELAAVKLVGIMGDIIELINIPIIDVVVELNKGLLISNNTFIQVGGHYINPKNVFCLESTTTEIESNIKTSNSKTISKTVIVPVVRIMGQLGCEIEIQGIAMSDIETAFNTASEATGSPVETTVETYSK